MDKQNAYCKGLEKITVSTLFAAGLVDNFSGIVNMDEAYRRFSSVDKTRLIFLEANGYSTEYGHMDLILGKAAPAEVYPEIARWLKERSQRPAGASVADYIRS